MFERGFVREIHRAWALIAARYRLRLLLVAAFGVLIAGLDTIALLLLFGLINLLDNQPVTGLTSFLVSGGKLTSEQRFSEALTLLLFAATLFIVRSLLSIFGLWLTVVAVNAAQLDVMSRLLFGHAHASHLTRLERNSSETLRTISISVDQVLTGIIGASVGLVSNAAVSVAVLVGLILASPSVALIVTGYFFAIGLFWVQGVRGALARRGRQQQELYEERLRIIMQGLGAAKELQLRGRAVFYADEAVTRTRGLNKASRGVYVVNGSLRYVLETSLVIAALLIVASAGLLGGHAAILASVGLVLAAAFRLIPALNQTLALINGVQSNGYALSLVEEEMKTFATGAHMTSSQTDSEVPALQIHGALRLEGVTFRYPTRTQPALSGIDLTVEAGESVGIVGPTGSGKSTLLDLVLGFLPPDSGSVTVDGVPMQECRDGWQRSLGYVPQDVYLVDDSIRANVALGWRGAQIDDEAVAAAVRLAQLEDVIRGLPAGLETVIGERGVRLSGGQRQRLGLARALYIHPSVLILDEATSNLDVATEQRIVETLAELSSGLTTIVVTHRIPSVRNCDRIIYLDNGVVRFEGKFDGLMSFFLASGNSTWADAFGADTRADPVA